MNRRHLRDTFWAMVTETELVPEAEMLETMVV
jgi:hypothetical protein